MIHHEPLSNSGGLKATALGWNAHSAVSVQPGNDTITAQLTVTYALT